jgi:hypothetical protein
MEEMRWSSLSHLPNQNIESTDDAVGNHREEQCFDWGNEEESDCEKQKVDCGEADRFCESEWFEDDVHLISFRIP